MRPTPTDGYSITVRLRLANKPGVLGLVTSTIGEAGGSIGAIDIVEADFDNLVRDITIATGNDQHAQEIVESVKALPGVTFIHFSDRVFLLHIGGKIEIKSKIPIQTRADLSRAYTPGVARVCMARDPIVFALANPSPEITPEEASPWAKVIATGRSDYPNQINNVLCFPGIFRGALDCRASEINESMKLAAAHAIAACISDAEWSADYIIPSVFNRRVTAAVAAAVEEAAYETGVARRERNRANG